MSTHTASRDFSPNDHKVTAVKEFVDSFLAGISFDGDQHDIQLAIEEYYVNIQKHGFNGTSNGELNISLKHENGWLEITFVDNGPKFDPHTAKARDHPENVESAKIGGLGVYLVRKLMDETSYRREKGMNIFRMRKRLDGANS